MPHFLHPSTAEWPQTYKNTPLKEPDSTSSASSDGDTDNIETLDMKLSKQFTNEIRDLAKIKSHRKVAVQLISWEVEGEDCMDTTKELEDLKSVFKEDYNFVVYVNKMTTMTGEPARHQLTSFLSLFLCKHDRKDTLLIIYYGGHGIRSSEDGQLKWVAGNPSATENGPREIVWTSTEHLFDVVDADLLAIFDCCHAGVLERVTRGSRTEPIYEFIGSTPFNKTARGPGDHSFTRALIASLTKLSERKDGFTTSELLQEIKTYPAFLATGQQPVSSERSKKVSFKKLQIKPLPDDVDEEAISPEQDGEVAHPIQYFLVLKYVLTQKPTPTDITALTKGLHNLVVRESVPIRHVFWDKLYAKPTLRDVAKIMIHRSTQNRRLSSASSAASLEMIKTNSDEIDLNCTVSPLPDNGSITRIADSGAGLAQIKTVGRTNSDRSHMSNDSRCSAEEAMSTISKVNMMFFAFSLGVVFAKGPEVVRLWLKL